MNDHLSQMEGMIPSAPSWERPDNFSPFSVKSFYRHVDEVRRHIAQTLESLPSEKFTIPTGLDGRLAKLEVDLALSAATDFLANGQLDHAKKESFRALYLADCFNDIDLLTKCFHWLASIEEYQGNKAAVRVHCRAFRLACLIGTSVKCSAPLLPTEEKIARYNSRRDGSFQQPHNDEMPPATPGFSSHLKRKREIHDVDSWYNDFSEAMAAEAQTLDISQPQAEDQMELCDSEHVEAFQQPHHETRPSTFPGPHQKRKREVHDEDPSKKVKTFQPQAEQQMRPHDNIPLAFRGLDAYLKRKRGIHDEDPFSNTMTAKKSKASTFGSARRS